MQKVNLFLLLLSPWLLVFSCAQKPIPEKAKLKWLSLADAQAKSATQKKPLLVDLYTDWCGWCKVMDKKTYTNTKVVTYINEHFYPVKLDAETRQKQSWAGKEYSFNSQYRANDIAIYLTRGNLSFPTTIFIPSDGVPRAIAGYMKPAEIELFLKYFGEGAAEKMSLEDFSKGFKSEW
jgi:thioredoxin-related protein